MSLYSRAKQSWMACVRVHQILSNLDVLYIDQLVDDLAATLGITRGDLNVVSVLLQLIASSSYSSLCSEHHRKVFSAAPAWRSTFDAVAYSAAMMQK
jgi:hypothetical protein